MHTHVTNTYAQLHAHEHSHIHAQNTHTDLWTHTLFPTSDSITLSMWVAACSYFHLTIIMNFFPGGLPSSRAATPLLVGM